MRRHARAFELFPSERQLHRRRKSVPLPPKAFDALLLLVQNAGRLVRRDDLFELLWPDTHVEDANLTNTIVALRKILGKAAVETGSKFGYRFALPVAPATQGTSKSFFRQSIERTASSRSNLTEFS